MAGASVCDDCPGDRFSTPGATSCDLCNAGFYYDIDQTCVVCPDGTECPTDGGSTQESLTLQEGYWRIDATSDDIYECPIDGACIGDSATTSTSSGGRRRRELLDESSAYGDRYCAKGYEGPLCGVCSSEFHYDDDSKKCEECDEQAQWASIAFSKGMLALYALLLLLLLWYLLTFDMDGVVEAMKDIEKEQSKSDQAAGEGSTLPGVPSDVADMAEKEKVQEKEKETEKEKEKELKDSD